MTTTLEIPTAPCNIAIFGDMTMKRATVIAQRTNSTLAGVAKAMMIDLLKEKLRNGVAHFLFVKKDGTLREAWGTTKKELVSKHINGRGESRENYACCCFWDAEAGSFRSFRWENLVQVF
jgi:hypothetical protein